jgi:hypothetical protein
VPFVRFSRDKRGYEHVYLVEPFNQRGKPSRPRVLYWFRTPPGVKVGRAPFDPATQRALEAQNPGVTFDWARIVSTPMPPPEIDWRERRRTERAAKHARAADTEPPVDEREPSGPAEGPGVDATNRVEMADIPPVTAVAAESAESVETPGAQPANRGPGQRRRRRGGRRRHRQPQEGAAVTTGNEELDQPNTPPDSSNEG